MFAKSQTKRIDAAAELAVDPDRAWAPYEPDDDRPWDLRQVGHLYRRAGLGASWSQLGQALKDGPQQAIERLLRPDEAVGDYDRMLDEYESAVARSDSGPGLRGWWLRRMIETPHPLQERMTLFWHSHFATSITGVGIGELMRRQLGLLRRHALGSFAPLLAAIGRDPAMLLWLNSGANRRARPQSGYARALLERFTLGPKRFSEKDVSETARAFTGHFVLKKRFRFVEREHDTGDKTILGQRGNWNADDAIRIALEQPASAQFIVRKLYGWLISEIDEPADALIAPLAEAFADGYDIARLVERMLRSNLFFSPAAYRRRIKSPVEFALGIIRGLEAIVPTTVLGQHLAMLGQSLYQPPTVRGWAGGHNWINGATLLVRHNLALALLSGKDPYGDRLDPEAVARRRGYPVTESAGRFLLELYLQGDVADDVRKAILNIVRRSGGPRSGGSSAALRRAAHAIVTLPEFQLA